MTGSHPSLPDFPGAIPPLSAVTATPQCPEWSWCWEAAWTGPWGPKHFAGKKANNVSGNIGIYMGFMRIFTDLYACIMIYDGFIWIYHDSYGFITLKMQNIGENKWENGSNHVMINGLV